MRSPQQAPEIPGHTYVRLISNKGGFGDVYLFEEVALHRSVAIKVIRDTALDPATQSRFENEARTMAGLEHPNVVRIYATGRARDGRPYISMMHCPKPTLAQRAAAGQLPLSEVLDIGISVGGAIESAHRAGVLHRDIKPANILTMPWGAAGLTDFGVAASLSLDTDDDDAGVSIPWSPPEMLFTTTRGSPASDVYSLAATLWHILVGRSPFEVPGGDNSRMTLMSRIRDMPAPMTGRADVPSSLDRTLQRAMAKSPAMRPQSVAEFARALQAVQQELRAPMTPFVVLETSQARPVGSPRARSDDVARTSRRSQLGGEDSAFSSSGVQRVPVIGDSSSDRLSSRSGSSDGRPSAGSSRADDLEGLGDGVQGDRTAYGASEPAERVVGTWALVLAAVLIAVVALGVGYLIFGGEGADSEPRSVSTQSAADPGSALASLPPGELTVTGTWVKDRRPRFAWTYAAALDSDRYRIVVSGGEELIVDEPTVSVPVSSSTQRVCVRVQVVRAGPQQQGQGLSPQTCVTRP
ncbi:MAG: serine/threonine-protein kinase [Nostocoides sp.]